MPKVLILSVILANLMSECKIFKIYQLRNVVIFFLNENEMMKMKDEVNDEECTIHAPFTICFFRPAPPVHTFHALQTGCTSYLHSYRPTLCLLIVPS